MLPNLLKILAGQPAAPPLSVWSPLNAEYRSQNPGLELAWARNRPRTTSRQRASYNGRSRKAPKLVWGGRLGDCLEEVTFDLSLEAMCFVFLAVPAFLGHSGLLLLSVPSRPSCPHSPLPSARLLGKESGWSGGYIAVGGVEVYAALHLGPFSPPGLLHAQSLFSRNDLE